MKLQSGDSPRSIALIGRFVLFGSALVLFIGAMAVNPSQGRRSTLMSSATTTRTGRMELSIIPPAARRTPVAGTASAHRALLRFEPNRGKTDASVKFMARGNGYNLFLTADEAFLVLDKGSAATAKGNSRLTRTRRERKIQIKHAGLHEPDVVAMRLAGASSSANIQAEDELPGKVNYFIGNNPAKWRANIPTYARVRYKNVYPGIDLVYYGSQRELEYDLVIAPGADPKSVRFSLTGVRKIDFNGHGDLMLHTLSGNLRLRRPEIYQVRNGNREKIAGNYVLRGRNEIAFRVAEYDRRRALVVDPVLSYSTYLGGSNDDDASAIAVDMQGNTYVTGETYSTNFPHANSFQSILRGAQDAFVTKFDPTGALVYSTYLGGSGVDYGISIAVDSDGSAYLTGSTDSADFPTTNGAYQTSCSPSIGNSSFCNETVGFATKLGFAGDSLTYSTYLNAATPYGIAVDSNGSAYVTGETGSIDFPTANAIQPMLAGYVFYKSTNGGNGWQQTTNNLPDRETETVALDPQTPTTLYLGLVNGTLYKSTDGGATWTEKDQGLPGDPIVAIAIDPVTPSTIYVAPDDPGSPLVTDGVYKSTDGGDNWSPINSGLTELKVATLAIDPQAHGTIYAGVISAIHHPRLFKSTDGGANWSAFGTGFPDDGEGATRLLAIDPQTPANIFSIYSIFQLTGGVEYLQAITVFKSTDGGATWTRSDSGIPGVIVDDLAIDPTTPTTLYATEEGTPILVKSTNAGTSWTTVGNGLPGTALNPIAIDPLNTSTLYVGTGGSGLFKSTDGGANFTALNVNGNRELSIRTLAVDPVSTANVYAGGDLQPDGFVLKLNPDGTAAIYSTYLGGDDYDIGSGIAVDPMGNAYVTGSTQSTNFPVAQAFQGTPVGLGSAFVTKLNPSGSAFVYSTYLGGTENRNGAPAGQDGSAIAADSSGNAYVTGSTSAVDFPLLNAVQPSLKGFFGPFVTKFDGAGSLLYSTYLDGSGFDMAKSIAVDGLGNATVTGSTSSTDFPLVKPLQCYAGSSDAFVTTLSADGSSLLFSTPLGGSDLDGGTGVAVDSMGNIYVAGSTASTDFPLMNPAQSGFGGSGQLFIGDAFVTKIAVSGASGSDVSIVKCGNPSTVSAGDNFTYTIYVTNSGPLTATNVTVTDALPPGTALISVTSSRGSCGGTSTITCNLGDMNSNDSATIALRVTSNAPGTIANTGSVASTSADPNSANNTSTAKTTVTGQPVLRIISIAPLANHHISLECLGFPNEVNRIEASPDLSPGSFTTIDSVAVDSTGLFQFEDTSAGSFSRRFYRVAYP